MTRKRLNVSAIEHSLFSFRILGVPTFFAIMTDMFETIFFVGWDPVMAIVLFCVMYFVAGYLEYLGKKPKKRLPVFLAIWFGGFLLLGLL